MKKERMPVKISESLIQDLAAKRSFAFTPERIADLYMPPRTLGSTEDHQVAMDAQLSECGFHSLLGHAMGLGMGMEEIMPQFLGYPYLAGLAQNGLIRAGVTTTADEMTKRWVEIQHGGQAEPGDDKIRALSADMKKFRLQGIFNEAAQKCDFDGGCLVYIDLGDLDAEELRQPLHLDPATFRPGRLRRFTLVEAINLYPGLYNATDPLAPDYFEPESWLVLGREIHKSRFLYFAPNKVPMLLRPAYNFFGIPAAQLVLDYVAHFTKCREAAMRLLTKFSLTVFKSNMAGILQGGTSQDMDARMEYFAQYRDNDSILLIDKETEDIVKLETPIAGVTDVVRQALEFVAAIFRMPVVKLLGISPAGMNSTGEFDERNFYDHVGSKQEKILSEPLARALDVLQLNLFGEIDPDLKAAFVPLTDEDDAQESMNRKTEADRDAVYVQIGVLGPEEVRQKLADDENSGYSFIDPEQAPEAPENEGLGGEGEGEFGEAPIAFPGSSGAGEVN